MPTPLVLSKFQTVLRIVQSKRSYLCRCVHLLSIQAYKYSYRTLRCYYIQLVHHMYRYPMCTRQCLARDLRKEWIFNPEAPYPTPKKEILEKRKKKLKHFVAYPFKPMRLLLMLFLPWPHPFWDEDTIAFKDKNVLDSHFVSKTEIRC